VLAALLLRGPQTLNELTLRTERLADFQGAEDVADTLRRLSESQPPLACNLGRGAGQREDRYMHLLSGPVDLSMYTFARYDERAVQGRNDLEARVDELERLVEHLRVELDRLGNNSAQT